MNHINDYGWIILPVFGILPIFLIVEWALRRYHSKRFDQYQFHELVLIPKGPFTGLGPKNYIRPDLRIIEEINDRLFAHGYIDPTDIKVSVHEGMVVLSGSVDSRSTRRLAEEIVDSVSGIIDVRNDLNIRTMIKSIQTTPGLKTEAYSEKKSNRHLG
jgi:hypothetical protein